ncbi:MAG: hypothetical protein Q9184_003179 [Pyrenodesmia sp. 2 TL-2023]
MKSILRCLGTQSKVSSIPQGCPDPRPQISTQPRCSTYVSLVEMQVILREVHFTIPMFSVYLPVSRDSDGDRTLPILINGVETRVGNNLWEALYHLRDPREERVLWVDAICINQHDLAEKAIVVPRMNLIYRRAAEVIIWLGPHPPPKIVNLERMAWWAFSPPSIDKAYHQEWWHQAVPWLFDLMHANYWTRTWIIQEVGEAVRLTVQFGKQSMRWEAFVAAVATYRKCFPRAVWTERVSALEDLRRSRREGEIYSLTDLISVFRNSFCKVPHDKIYAFLGMATDDSPNFIPAAYNKTLAQVYGDVMRFLGSSTIDRAVKEVELVHMSALVRRLLTRRTSKTVAVDEKPTSILRQAEPYTYYDRSAPDKDGRRHLQARTAYHKQWYEWVYKRHEQTVIAWLPTAPERLDLWTDISQEAPQTDLLTAKGIIVGEIESFGPTVESFLTSSGASKAWQTTIIQQFAGKPSQKSMMALCERLHVVIGQQAASTASIDWTIALRPKTGSAAISTTDAPRLFIGSTGFFGIASPGASVGDRVVQFWASSAAAIVRRDENRGADGVEDSIVARGSIVKEGYSHDWDVPQDKHKFGIGHEESTIRLHLDLDTLTAMTLNSWDMNTRGSKSREAQSSTALRTTASKLSPKPGFPFKDTRRYISPNTTTERSSVIGARIKKKPTSKVPKAHPPRNQNVATTALIRILVNNRLGTRLEITCAPYDSIGDVKKIVAFQSGIKPETIVLKRQGMQPFKDALTLEDYEVGNGSSLDLETDTTD